MAFDDGKFGDGKFGGVTLANDLNLREYKARTKTLMYLRWDRPPGAKGYLILLNGTIVSRTFDPLHTELPISYHTGDHFQIQAVDLVTLKTGELTA